MANHAIIVAAGAGKRFGGKKQFYPVQGRPLFLYATSAFESHSQIQTIVLVVPKRQKVRIKKLTKAMGLSKVRYVVSGGQRRQDSVINGLRVIKDKSGVVIIHDAVRPMVSKATIGKGIALCRKYKSVVLTIRNAIATADSDVEYTDEAAMLESLGLPVYLFIGDRYNIKVTDKRDLKIMEKLLS